MVLTSPFGRRDFLRLITAAGAALAATGAACGSGPNKPESTGKAAKGGASGGDRTLRIAQWRHGIPAYDVWFDNDFAKRWGEQHDVEVVVDHLNLDELPARAEAEVAGRGPHDIFGFVYPPPTFEDEVIDHRDIVEEVEGKVGKMTPLVERCVVNPRTGKYFGFCNSWAADPINYRADLWARIQPALSPDTWEFLVDLALSSREAVLQSAFYNLPAFPGAIPDLPDLLAKDGKANPTGKYTFLRDATSWSTNLGHPGHANAATEEVFNRLIVPTMFAAVARGEMEPTNPCARPNAR
ncbi:MAG: twin-arginine translocation signal domain-containing protein [Acidimicrobiia bacterium]